MYLCGMVFYVYVFSTSDVRGFLARISMFLLNKNSLQCSVWIFNNNALAPGTEELVTATILLMILIDPM